MTIPFLNVRPRAIKLKVLPKFPAQLIGRTGIDVVKQNGSYFLDLDYGDFGSTPTPPAGTNVLVFDPVLNSYVQVPLSAIGGGVPEAPNDGVQYGRQSLGWTPVTGGGGGGIPEAPIDGIIYGRRNAAWTAALDAGAVRYDSAQSLTAAQKVQARSNIYAAPFDALAFNGLQLNGAMDVSQERGQNGTGASGTYPLDGWLLGKTGTMTVTAQQFYQGALAGLPNILNIAVSVAQGSLGSGDSVWVRHAIEGYRAVRLAWGKSSAQSLTLGFWTAHARAGIYSGSVRNGGLTRGYAFTYTQDVANAWEYKTVTIPSDVTGTWADTNGVGIYVTFVMAAGSGQLMTPGAWSATALPGATGQINAVAATSDVFRLTGLLVLPGTEAPIAERAALIMRPIDFETRLCLRHYWSLAPGVANAENIAGGMASATQGYYPISFPVGMRAIPTGSVSAASDWQNNPFVSGATIQPGTAAQFAGLSPFGCRFGLTSATTGMSGSGFLSILDATNANAKINFDARLP